MLLWSVALVAATAFAETPRRRETTTTPVPGPAGAAAATGETVQPPVEMSPEARPAVYAPELFAPDPGYQGQTYDVAAQLAIYGGKTRVDAPRPPIEWGYPLYDAGPIGPGINLFGSRNPARPQLLAFGDLRYGVAYNDNGARDSAQMALRLNLDFDLRLTATERVHLFLRPLDNVKSGHTTRWEFGGDQNNHRDDVDLVLDLDPEALFFEGDLGQIAAGLSGKYNAWDVPVAFGLMPLLFQNGIWMEDAILGAAITAPAMNSPRLDISNMDVTLFAGFDRVTTKAVLEPDGDRDDHDAEIYGVAVFVEAREAYIEAGYGYTLDTKGGAAGDASYHNATLAVTRRWLGLVSNSVRLIGNFGQDHNANFTRTADGWLLLVENSMITSLPSTLVPYVNLFCGIDRPQSLARDFGAGGILKNTGINFETDGLTGFPKLDDSANDAWGGAAGLEYLFALDRQVIVEVATVLPFGDDDRIDRVAKGDQAAIGIRYQQPLSKNWILRSDAILASREGESDLAGIRFELRLKF